MYKLVKSGYILNVMSRRKDPSEVPFEGPRGGTSTVTKGGLIRTVVFFSPEERRALKITAAERDTNVSELVREAVRGFLGID